MSDALTTIVFAGGGSGGHIFPNLAIAQRLGEQGLAFNAHFLVSARPLDAQILRQHAHVFTALPVEPLPRGLGALARLPGFVRAWRNSVAAVRRVILQERVGAVVATGGFASGPAVWAASRTRVPVTLVNLDDPPGWANRLLARRADTVFSVFDGFKGQRIGYPLRGGAVGGVDPASARQQLGLNPDRHTLLVTGGSQGAATVNQMMACLVQMPEAKLALAGWQVLHLTGGEQDIEPLGRAYEQAGVPSKVQPFCEQMGLAWCAATVAISRAGAGSVAEVWANATPTIFLPYPYHKDQHQKKNAKPLVAVDGAVICDDLIDAQANADQLLEPLTQLMGDNNRRRVMIEAMRRSQPPNGAAVVADWVTQRIKTN